MPPQQAKWKAVAPPSSRRLTSAPAPTSVATASPAPDCGHPETPESTCRPTIKLATAHCHTCFVIIVSNKHKSSSSPSSLPSVICRVLEFRTIVVFMIVIIMIIIIIIIAIAIAIIIAIIVIICIVHGHAGVGRCRTIAIVARQHQRGLP